MAQVTIYMNNELESKIKNIANSLNISISKFIANVSSFHISDMERRPNVNKSISPKPIQ